MTGYLKEEIQNEAGETQEMTKSVKDEIGSRINDLEKKINDFSQRVLTGKPGRGGSGS